jgi:hypothetical protein
LTWAGKSRQSANIQKREFDMTRIGEGLGLILLVFLAAAFPAAAQTQNPCRTGDLVFANNFDVPATMTVRTGGGCGRRLTTTEFRLREMQFIERPRHGTLRRIDRNSYSYVPRPGYIGPDSFHVRYVGEKLSPSGEKLFNVFQGVKWSVSVVP